MSRKSGTAFASDDSVRCSGTLASEKDFEDCLLAALAFQCSQLVREHSTARQRPKRFGKFNFAAKFAAKQKGVSR